MGENLHIGGNIHEDIFAQQRAWDKIQADKKQVIAKAEHDSRKLINKDRREEAARTYRELTAPQGPPKAAARGGDDAPVGTPIEMYVWEGGIMGTINMFTKGGFTPLPPPT